MEDNKMKKELNDEELMNVSGGLSSNYSGADVCPKCGEITKQVPVFNGTGLKFVCSSCGHEWIIRKSM